MNRISKNDRRYQFARLESPDMARCERRFSTKETYATAATGFPKRRKPLISLKFPVETNFLI